MTELTITFRDGGKLTVKAETWELTRDPGGRLKLEWTAAPGEEHIDFSHAEIVSVYAKAPK